MEVGSKTKTYHKLEKSSDAFLAALERYMDENKPDPLIKKQIEEWELSWSDQEASEHDNLSSFVPSEWNLLPTDVIQGTLTWKGDYLIAQVHVLCCWEPTAEVSCASKMAKGSLYFTARANLRFRTNHDTSSSDGESRTKEEKKSQEKIRSKMIKRLREDKFIKRLVLDNKIKSSEIHVESPVLCEAYIKVYTPENDTDLQFEERADVTDNIAEGLRRGVFSQAESSLDVAEVLLNLPFLPGSVHNLIPCPLADRAKLRLLEDAMFDECERQDDELIDELKISCENGQKTEESTQKGSNKRAKRR